MSVDLPDEKSSNAASQERPLAGIAANAAAFAAISAGDSMSKLAVAIAPATQIIAIRSFLVLLLVTPLFIAEARRGRPVIRTQKLGLHLLRCALQGASVLTFFVALRELPLTTITAIMFIAPSLVALVSAPVLNEQIRPPQIVALVLGLIGCFIILRPSGEGQAFAILLAIFSAATWAFSMALLRLLTRTESQATIYAWSNGCFMLLAGAISIFDLQPIEPKMLLLILGMAATQVVGQWFSMTAFRIARAATVAPMQYTQLLWATLFGSLLFAEWPPASVWIGAGFIVAGGLWLVWAEGRREPPRLAGQPAE
ncbi:DMT family transporter [Terrarubrum flagellatum]|uniref:DMT family transporter n=1 Tax=Terrirubrum flagellatum TaxID=2895980 RepID=UPI0031451B75